jgi:putative transcriptional regulator
MISHHPHEDMLIEYANGSLPAAESLLVASHASMCGECQYRIADFETIGAALMDSIDEAPIDETSLRSVLDRIDGLADETATAADEKSAPAGLDEETLGLVPPPLRPLLTGSLTSLQWRRIGRGLRRAALGTYGSGKVSLIEIRPGGSVPAHTHTGDEYTLVLQGAFHDETGDYATGDVAYADPDLDHRPRASSDGPCLCLTIEGGPVRLTGPVSRLLNRIVKG